MGAKINRRRFLQRTASLSAGVVAFPYIMPAKALGRGGHTAPSNRLNMGCIGVGSQGTGNMKGFLGIREFHVVAVCDVDRDHRQNAKEIVDRRYSNTDCADYNDFRELLEHDDIDVVSIAVPDHWHAIPAIAAAKKGYDIYAEKPLALTIPQGRAMCDAVERYGTVWQTGSWQRSQEHFRRACEVVRSGLIGTVERVEVGLPTGPSCPPQPEMPIPEGFDYDLWLGPALAAPYTEKRCHWDFRWILEYSGGQLTDWAAHHCDIANWGMGTEYTGPTAIRNAQGSFPTDGLWNAATDYAFEAVFAPGASPVAPKGFTMHVSNKNRGGATFIGSEGRVWVDRSGWETEPETLQSAPPGRDAVRLYESNNHARNWLDCIHSRAKTITPIEVAHRAIAIAHLGNIAMFLHRDLTWDPAKEVIAGDADAARLLDRSMREPWHI
ncbi:MAG: Gfo/Idh/MocA family protein [Candidatus Hydrogenedentota bacterium]